MNTSSSLVSAPVVSCLQAHHGRAFVRLALHLLGRSGRGLLRRAAARTCHAHQQARAARSQSHAGRHGNALQDFRGDLEADTEAGVRQSDEGGIISWLCCEI